MRAIVCTVVVSMIGVVRPDGTGSRVSCPSLPRTIRNSWFPRLVSRIEQSVRETRKVSGVTAPDTTASPSPATASTTTMSRLPVTGSAVKTIPAVTDDTIRCTTTAISGSESSPLSAR